MSVARAKYRVLVDRDLCWGRLVGEDSQQESCRRCVEICPEVFDKEQRQSILSCPVDAIQLVETAVAPSDEATHAGGHVRTKRMAYGTSGGWRR
jgi:ferredoxin